MIGKRLDATRALGTALERHHHLCMSVVARDSLGGASNRRRSWFERTRRTPTNTNRRNHAISALGIALSVDIFFNSLSEQGEMMYNLTRTY